MVVLNFLDRDVCEIAGLTSLNLGNMHFPLCLLIHGPNSAPCSSSFSIRVTGIISVVIKLASTGSWELTLPQLFPIPYTVTLVAWNWPLWKYLHHRHGQTLQKSELFPREPAVKYLSHNWQWSMVSLFTVWWQVSDILSKTFDSAISYIGCNYSDLESDHRSSSHVYFILFITNY